MQESKIEQELLAATSLPAKKKEERQAYLVRLVKAVSNLKDPEWEGLSTEAQNWTNGAAEAVKAKDDVEDFDDFEELVGEEEEAPPVRTKAKNDAKVKPEKEEAPKQTVSAPPRRVSACHSIKKLVVKNPKITVIELSEKLKSSGLKVSDVTISTLRSDIRDTLRVLNELQMGSFVL